MHAMIATLHDMTVECLRRATGESKAEIDALIIKQQKALRSKVYRDLVNSAGIEDPEDPFLSRSR